jgi:hypothetical protein
MVIHQGTWFTYPPWTNRHSSWKPLSRSSRSKWLYYLKKLLQKQSCFGWHGLILPWSLRENLHSKFTFGTFCSIKYEPSEPDHRSRSHNVFTSVSGEERIRNYFDIILPQVSCLFPFFKSMLFNFKNAICRIPSLGDEGVQRILCLAFRLSFWN